MKRLKIFFIILLVFFSSRLEGHNPELSSIVLVDKGDNEWVLQIQAALTGFEYAITEKYGEGSFDSPEEFMELVIDHLTENVSIKMNDEDVILKNGSVKLGHETAVAFNLESVPNNIEKIEVINTSFASIYRNKSALFVLKEGIAKSQFPLEKSNNHSVKIKLQENSFVLDNEKEAIQESNSMFIYLLLALIGLSMVFLIVKLIKTPYNLSSM
jgi:hypothetical protein